MKKLFLFVGTALFICSVLWIVYYFYSRLQHTQAVNYQTKSPVVGKIEVKIIATGSIIPLKEIKSKPEVPGILESIYVAEGDRVVKGQKLARIKIIADPVALNQTMNDIEEAKLSMDYSENELNRQKTLYNGRVISEMEYKSYLNDFNLKKERYNGLAARLDLLKNGRAAKGLGKTNVIYASADGLVVSIPVKEGETVIESNAFNEGTTICTIANMQKLMFEGYVEESEVSKISVGMNMSVSVGAVAKRTFSGKINYISEKGDKVEGAIKFLIRAQLTGNEGEKLRLGYSATAEIILAHKENILTIDEGLLTFDSGKPYIELEKGSGNFQKQYIQTGISDGIVIEVTSPLDKNARIKYPENK